jgi:catechol 2,3-dioxygenase-like lactoylglutathione lyase family enzyme
MAAAEIHHVQVAIPAGGEEPARRFYGELLGFAELSKPANLARRGGAWFRTGNLDLHLGVDPAFRPATKAHVAYRVSGLPTFRQRLTEAGHTCVDDEPLPGFDRFYVDDPCGNRVELLEDKP